MATSPDNPLVSAPDLRTWFNLSQMTEYRLRKNDPDFPTAFKLGGKVYYDPDEARAYLEKKRLARRTSEDAQRAPEAA